MNLENIIFIVFSVVGIIQFLKGFLTVKQTWVWALVQIVLCFAFAAVWQMLPSWVSTAIVSLSVSQIGYETVVQSIKKRLDQCT